MPHRPPPLNPPLRRFEPRDAGWEAKVRASFGRQKVMAFLGAELSELRPGHCEIRLPFREELTQQHGYLQAGIVSSIADNAGGYAGFSLMAPGSDVLAVEFKINFLAPAEGEVLVAVGEVIKPGKTLVITRGEVYGLKDGRTTHCATMQQTLMAVYDRAN
jgi:uncharacterized protein (TIGR00369 family)